MNHAPLVQALADALLLLEFAGPEEIDPDTAVRGMENIAASLLLLSQEDQISLRKEFVRLADASSDAPYKKFLLSVPDSLGLAE
jgi:hypothetical protein